MARRTRDSSQFSPLKMARPAAVIAATVEATQAASSRSFRPQATRIMTRPKRLETKSERLASSGGKWVTSHTKRAWGAGVAPETSSITPPAMVETAHGWGETDMKEARLEGKGKS